ncbi:MAG: tetratricopeptide repeat protein [Fimbriimonadales bacterium]
MPPVPELLERARGLIQQGKYDAAADMARELIGEHGDDPEAFNLLGIALSRSNRPTEATDAFATAARLDPASPKAHYNLAAHYYSVGNKDKAATAAQDALGRDPGHQAAQALLARIRGEAAQPAPPPTPSEPGYWQDPERPTHSIGFVKGLGCGWEVLGWFFFAALMATRFVLDSKTNQYLSGSITYETMSRAGQLILENHMQLVVGSIVWFGLLCAWWAVDIADRRPAGGLVTTSVFGMLGVCFCIYFTLFVFPLYVFARKRPWGRRP